MEQSKKDDLIQAMHRLKRTQNWLPPISGVSRGEFFMMHKIVSLSKNADGDKPGTKITDLSVATEMSKPAVSQMLNALEGKGLIERVMTKSDRRVVYVKLTESGEAQLKKTADHFSALLEEIVEELGQEDTAELARLFEKLYMIMEQITKRKE